MLPNQYPNSVKPNENRHDLPGTAPTEDAGQEAAGQDHYKIKDRLVPDIMVVEMTDTEH